MEGHRLEHTWEGIRISPNVSRRIFPTSFASTIDMEFKRGSVYHNTEKVKKMQKMELSQQKMELQTCSEKTTFPFSGGTLSQGTGREVYDPYNSEARMSNHPSSDFIAMPSNGKLLSSPDFLNSKNAGGCRHNNFENQGKSCSVCLKSSFSEQERLVISTKTLCLGEQPHAEHSTDKVYKEKFEPTQLVQLEFNKSKYHSRTCFIPFRKLWSTNRKKSHCNSPEHSNKSDDKRCTKSSGIKNAERIHRPLLHDFPRTLSGNGCRDHVLDTSIVATSSSIYLHGYLKTEKMPGLPILEFSLEGSQEVISAKACRIGKEDKWVYTFHKRNKKGENAAHGKKDECLSTSMVGQMQVSCYFCSEIGSREFSENNAVIEFVCYDFTKVRKGLSSEIGSASPFKSNAFCPYWATGDLYAHLQSAAILVQPPPEAFQMLKAKMGNHFTMKENLDKLPYPFSVNEKSPKIEVVVPNGLHGLPTDGQGAPLSLLDRWRLGGGCDCGGWDVGCPVSVLKNSHAQMDFHKSQTLYNQGMKERVPALSMGMTCKGLYEVIFQAKLSSMQAFAISLAFLHQEILMVWAQNSQNKTKCKSSDTLLEEEIGSLIEPPTIEGRKIPKMVDTLPMFALEPPFSPMGRI